MFSLAPIFKWARKETWELNQSFKILVKGSFEN